MFSSFAGCVLVASSIVVTSLLGAIGSLLSGIPGLSGALLDPLAILGAGSVTAASLAASWVAWLGVEASVMLVDLLGLG